VIRCEGLSDVIGCEGVWHSILWWTWRDLAELQDSGANRRGIEIAHHFEGLFEEQLLRTRALAARRVLVQRRKTARTTEQSPARMLKRSYHSQKSATTC
jgi:hypothetical protein